MRLSWFLSISLFVATTAQAQLSQFDFQGPPPHMPDDVETHYREYGDDTAQHLTFSCPDDEAPRPLIAKLSTDFWEDGQDQHADGYLAPYGLDHGYCYADINVRYDADIDEALADIVAALEYMRENVDEIGHDPERFLLVGRGNGAAVAALIATDPQYLQSSEIGFDALRGVILIEPDALDIDARAAQSRRLRDSYFPDFYGDDPARWDRYSAASHLEPPNAPEFFLVGRDGKPTYIDVARSFGRMLDEAGVPNAVYLLGRRRSLGSEERLSGDPADPTNALGAFLLRVDGRAAE